MIPKDQSKSSSQQERIDTYMQILEEDPKSRVFAPLAQILAQCGDLDKAKQVCFQGLQAHPEFSDGRLAYAKVLFLSRKYPQALREIQVTLNLNNRKPEAHLLACEIHLACGQPDKIRESCLKILELDPENTTAHKYLKLINRDTPNRKPTPDHKTDKCIPRPTQGTKVLNPNAKIPKAPIKRRVKLSKIKNEQISFNLSDLNSVQAIIDGYSMRATSLMPVLSDTALKVPRKRGPLWISLFILTVSVAVVLWFVSK